MKLNNEQVKADFFYLNNNDNADIDRKLLVGFIKADRIMLYLVFIYWLILATLGGASNGYYLLGYLGGGLALLIGVLGYVYFKGTYINRILIGCISCIVEVLYIQQELGSPTSHLIYFMSLGFLLVYRDGFAAVASIALVIVHHFTATYCESIGVEIMGMPILAFNWGRWDAFATHLYWALLMAVLLCLVTYNSMIEFMSSEKSILEITRFNKKLDLLVKKRKSLLTQKNAAISVIFSNISEAVLAICKDKTIDVEYSKSSVQILNAEDIAGKNAVSLLFVDSNISKKNQQEIEQAINNSFGKSVLEFKKQKPFMVNKCTKKVGDNYKDLEFFWQPIVDENNDVERILVSVRDNSEINELQKQADIKNTELSMVSELLCINDTEFFDFILISMPLLNSINNLLGEAEDIDKASNVLVNIQAEFKILTNDPVCLMLNGFRTKLVDFVERCEFLMVEDKFESEQLKFELDHIIKLLPRYEKLSSEYLSWERPLKKESEVLLASKRKILLLASSMENIDKLTPDMKADALNDFVKYFKDIRERGVQ